MCVYILKKWHIYVQINLHISCRRNTQYVMLRQVTVHVKGRNGDKVGGQPAGQISTGVWCPHCRWAWRGGVGSRVGEVGRTGRRAGLLGSACRQNGFVSSAGRPIQRLPQLSPFRTVPEGNTTRCFQ